MKPKTKEKIALIVGMVAMVVTGLATVLVFFGVL